MYQAILFLPLAGFLLAGLFPRQLGAKGCEYVTSGFLVIAAILSWIAFFTFALSEDPPYTIDIVRWINSGALGVNWAIRL